MAISQAQTVGNLGEAHLLTANLERRKYMK